MNLNICYLTGVLQTDGCIYKFEDKKRNKIIHRFRIKVSKKSLPMLSKIKEILKQEFDRDVSVLKLGINEYGKEVFSLEANITSLLPKFEKLGISKKILSNSIISNKKNFCAYLAGVIDGDGNICIKRPEYPQCRIKITSESKNELLKKLIEKYLNCKSWTEISISRYKGLVGVKKKNGFAFNQCFYVSPKNLLIFRNFVRPYIQISYKKATLDKFFSMKEN